MATNLPVRFGSVQVLRAVAANMVVVSHLANGESRFQPAYQIIPDCPWLGLLGVHIFFVISGLVIALVVARGVTPGRFLWDRATRIYPTWWIYLTLLVLIYAALPGTLADRSDVSLLKSYLLWPDAGQPLLSVGWTLIHETYFYGVIALLLLLRVPLLPGLLAWGLIISLPIPHSSPELTLVLSPMTYDFIGGALLAMVVLRIRQPAIPAYPLLEKLGDASYSVYLSHAVLMPAMFRLFSAQPWHGWTAEAVFLIGCFVAVNAWGWISYRYLEVPLISIARRLRIRHAERSVSQATT